MESTIKEIATVLHSTDTMADRFARRVQERVGQPVSYAEILAVVEKIPVKSLAMAKVIAKVKREREKKERKQGDLAQ